MVELELLVAGAASVVIAVYFLMGRGSPSQVVKEEEKAVEEETPQEMRENLDEYRKEAQEYQDTKFPPESDWGVNDD